MAQQEDLIIILIGTSVLTYASRVLPMLISSQYYPSWLKENLEFLPVSIITAVALPAIIIDAYAYYFLTPSFITTIIIIIIAIYTKSLVITTISSLVLLFFFNFILQ